MELTGQYNSCKIFTDNIDSTTISQIINILNQPQFKDSKIRIMPDAHAGKGCVIGTTMTFSDKIVPNLVGCQRSPHGIKATYKNSAKGAKIS